MKTHRTTSRCVTLIMPALILTLLTGLMLPVSGCQLFKEQLTADPGPIYPEDIEQGEVLDIQVFRDVTVLRFTNMTTIDFPPSTMWLNKRYSLVMPELASGQTMELNLRLFVDEFGDTYKAGGFYAQREPAPVVLAQIETTDPQGQPVLYGLVVVENKYD